MAPDAQFRDRTEAGQLLAAELRAYANRRDVVVLALPRGGVPVAFEVSRRLNVPLDVFLVRKLGVPWHPELAMGAIASGGVRVVNTDVVRAYGIPSDVIDMAAAREEQELARRERAYRGDRDFPRLTDQTVILIDDGLATGSSMRAAVAAVRTHKPAAIVVAVPVAAPETCAEFRAEADRVFCLRTPEPFAAVGRWYREFPQTTDEEVRDLLARAHVPATIHDT